MPLKPQPSWRDRRPGESREQHRKRLRTVGALPSKPFGRGLAAYFERKRPAGGEA